MSRPAVLGVSSAHAHARRRPLRRRPPCRARARLAGGRAALRRDPRRRVRGPRRSPDRHRRKGGALGGEHGRRDARAWAQRAALSARVAGRLPGPARPDWHSLHGAVDRPTRRAGVLRQRAPASVRHDARQRSWRGADPRLPHHHRSLARHDAGGDGRCRCRHEPARRLQTAGLDAPVAVRAFGGDHLSTRRRRAGSGDVDRQPERRADAVVDRLPSLLPALGLAARRLAAFGRRAHALAVR